jgi:ribosomal protein S27E
METSTREYDIVLSDPDVTCEIVKKADGFLHIVCAKCNEACTLFPRRQTRSLSGGESRDFYEITCPKCGPSPKMLSVLR